MDGEGYYERYLEKLGRLEIDYLEVEPGSCIRPVLRSAAEREQQKHHQQTHSAYYHPKAENYFVVNERYDDTHRRADKHGKQHDKCGTADNAAVLKAAVGGAVNHKNAEQRSQQTEQQKRLVRSFKSSFD